MDNNLYFDSTTSNLELPTELDSSNALPSEVKDNYIFNHYSSETLVGTMPVNSPNSIKINPSCREFTDNSYTIPEGYHAGHGIVYTGDLREYTFGNATSDDVVSGKVFWVNGERQVGRLDRGEVEQDADAEENDILEGKTAWVKRRKITGNIRRLPREDQNLSAGASYTIPRGFSAGTTIVSAKSLESQTSGDAEANEIFENKVAWVNGERVVGTFNFNQEIRNRFIETDALRNQVLAGKKFYSTPYGTDVEGTMPDHSGEGERLLQIGARYYIPEGYYNGQSYIITQTLREATEADAKPIHILNDRTAWVRGEKLTGTMPYNEETTTELSAGETHIIPIGYHSGVGKVVAKSISAQTQGTAEATDIIKNKIAWVNGQKVVGSLQLEGDALSSQVLIGKKFYVNNPHIYATGTMTNNGSVQEEISAGNSYTIPRGYHDGTGVVRASALSDQTSGSANANDILSERTAWVNGERITGAMPNNGHTSVVLAASQSYTIPVGYHDGQGEVVAKSLNEQTQGTATINDILYGRTAWANGQRLIGTIPRLVRQDKLLSPGESYTFPLGYSDGTTVISSKPLDEMTIGTASNNDILENKIAWVNGQQITGNIISQDLDLIRIASGNHITIEPGYYPNGVTIYSLYNDRLDLTGTDAYVYADNLDPNNAGHIEDNMLVVTSEYII